MSAVNLLRPAADCLDLARTLNALRVRMLLVAFCLVFGGWRPNQTIHVVLVAIGGVAVIGGLFVSTYIL